MWSFKDAGMFKNRQLSNENCIPSVLKDVLERPLILLFSPRFIPTQALYHPWDQV